MAIIKLDGGYNALPISYKRGNPIPLDTTAVWYDFAALETYAKSGVTAYVGQVLTYVDQTKNTATAYVIADTTGTLEPIGTAPIGDNKSIVVDEETGTVSLKGIDALVFTREVDILGEDGQPTGEKTTENVQYQPLMTKDGLVWVEPSKTTVEGLASLIDGLTVRVSALENDRVTEDELANAIKDFETKANVKAISDELVNVKATAEAAASKTYVDAELAKKAALDEFNALKGRVEAFLDNTGAATDAIDTLQELITYIEEHDDVELTDILADIKALQDKVVLGTDAEGTEYATVKAYVEAAINALAIGDYAKAADLTALASRVKALEDVDYFTQAEFETFNTTNTAAIGAAKEAAIAAAATDATTKANQALTNAKADTDTKLANYYTSTQVDNKLNLIDTELDTKQEKAPEGETYAYVSNITSAVNSLKNTEIKNAQDTADAAASAASDAQNSANTAQDTANGAAAQANTNKTAIEGHATRIGTLESTVGGHVTEISTLTGKVNTLEGEDTKINAAIATINGEITTLKAEDGKLAGNITTINEELGKKALATDITAINQKIGSTDDTAEENTVYGAIAKAQAAATYDDTEVKGLITTETARAKAAEEANATAITNEATRADTEEKRIVGLVEAEAARADAAEKANAKAIADEVTRAKAAEGKNAEDIAKIDAVLNTISDSDDITSLKELALWFEIHGEEAAEMSASINANSAAIANIYTPASGEGEEAVAASGMLVDVNTRVEALEEVDHAAAHATTLQSAKDYADGLASDYATAAQGAKADTAVQTVTSVANNGIKATRDENNNVVIDWDSNVTLILCGGGAN